MQVTYFRPRREGPELILENTVVDRLPELFDSSRPRWVAGSASIGAGMPDLVIMSYKPEILALAEIDSRSIDLLSYLRTVRCANIDTIVQRISQPVEFVTECILELVSKDVLCCWCDAFFLSPVWRDILSEITCIELKVSNWRRALAQAARNRIFAHYSYVALPKKLANRVQNNDIVSQLGLGVIAVREDESVLILKKARRGKPKVWNYYYRLAELTASHNGGGDGIRSRH